MWHTRPPRRVSEHPTSAHGPSLSTRFPASPEAALGRDPRAEREHLQSLWQLRARPAERPMLTVRPLMREAAQRTLELGGLRPPTLDQRWGGGPIGNPAFRTECRRWRP